MADRNLQALLQEASELNMSDTKAIDDAQINDFLTIDCINQACLGYLVLKLQALSHSGIPGMQGDSRRPQAIEYSRNCILTYACVWNLELIQVLLYGAHFRITRSAVDRGACSPSERLMGIVEILR